jgi:hypothetical protein
MEKLVQILAGAMQLMFEASVSLYPVLLKTMSFIQLLCAAGDKRNVCCDVSSDAKSSILSASAAVVAPYLLLLLCFAEPAIALLGAMQSMFEASMYSFVFLWTMALSPNKEAIKHGLIFVNFMTACMAGSFLSSVLMKHARPEKFMKGVFAVATAAMMVPMILALDTSKDPSKERVEQAQA